MVCCMPGKPALVLDGALYVADDQMSSVLRYQGPLDSNPGQFVDVSVSPGSGGLVMPSDLLIWTGRGISTWQASRVVPSAVRRA